MPYAMIVECPVCGQKNMVAIARGHSAVCGRCKEPLSDTLEREILGANAADEMDGEDEDNDDDPLSALDVAIASFLGTPPRR